MWKPYKFIFFSIILHELEQELQHILENDPEKLKNHLKAKLYTDVVKVMGQIIDDPVHEKYLLGKTLGKKHRDWRRAKELLPDRYRLFFKFFSAQHEIYFVWLNDENTLRKKGAKTDCYAVFKRMLKKGAVPSSRQDLRADSTPLDDT